MNKLFPPDPKSNLSFTTKAEIRSAVASEYRPAPAGRPWLLANMIASIDGGTAVDGLSGQLGGPADMTMFGALRAIADVIVVGASTVRQEKYQTPMNKDAVTERMARGQTAHPRLAVISASLSLTTDLALFTNPDNRPYVLTTGTAPAERRAALSEVAEIIEAGHDTVELAVALKALHQLGAKTVLSEGGPSINGQLIAADLVDEWNLSLSPRLLGGDSRRAAIGPLPEGPPVAMDLQRVWTDDNLLFCRWTRTGLSAPQS